MSERKRKMDLKDVKWELRQKVHPEEINKVLFERGLDLEMNVFQNPFWLSALSGGKFDSYLCWYRGEELIGLFNVIRTSKMRVNGLHIPPFTHTFAPIIANCLSNKVYYKVIDDLLLLLSKENVVDLKMSIRHTNILPYRWNGYQCNVLANYVIENDFDAYMGQLNKNKKREYNKLVSLIDSGELEILNEVDEKDFLSLFTKTSERSGFKANLTALSELLRNRENFPSKLLAVRSKKYGLISIGFFPYDDKTVYNVINASLRVDDAILKTVNLILLIEGIKFALDSDRVFDFEGSMLQGVSSFYELMGGEQVPVYRISKSKSLVFSALRAIKQIKDDRK